MVGSLPRDPPRRRKPSDRVAKAGPRVFDLEACSPSFNLQQALQAGCLRFVEKLRFAHERARRRAIGEAMVTGGEFNRAPQPLCWNVGGDAEVLEFHRRVPIGIEGLLLRRKEGLSKGLAELITGGASIGP